MPDPSPRSPRRIQPTIPYAALAKGHIDPDTAVELAERITGQPVRIGTRVLGKVLDATAGPDGIHATIELLAGADDDSDAADIAALRSPGGIAFGGD